MIGKKILVKMYLQDRLSMMEIAKKLDLSIRQVNYWINKYSIKTRKISEAIYLKHNKFGDPFKIPSFVKNKSLSNNKYFLYGLGLGLYWGEGNKKNLSSVRLGNSDPKLINKFIVFLVDVLKIDINKLRFGLQIFSDIKPDEAIKFWRKSLNLKNVKFQKPIVTKSGSIGTYRVKSKFGVLTIYFNNTKLRNFLIEKINHL